MSKLLPVLTAAAVGIVLLGGCADQTTGSAGESGSAGSTTVQATLPTTVVTSGTLAVPADLCSIASTPQQVADAFMGAVGAGRSDEATACLAPGAVPPDLVQKLLATGSAKTAYLPVKDNGSDSYTYQGTVDGHAAKVTVTVTKQPDGHFAVTGLTTS